MATHASRAVAAGLLVLLAACTGGTDDAPTGTSPTRAEPRGSLLVIGDSYAAGVGADTALTSFAWETGRLTGRVTLVDAVGGTGFVNPGAAGPDQSYPRRVTDIPADDLDVDTVVVEGGLNDRAYPAQDIQGAADEVLAELEERAPRARLVLLGAPAPDPALTAASEQVNTALAAAAADHGAVFVDPTAESWLPAGDAALLVGADRLHPTQAGHDVLARRLAQVLDSLGG